MLFFSEYGQLMYSDGKNCIELFGDKNKKSYLTAADLQRPWAGYGRKASGKMPSPNNDGPLVLSEEDEMSDDEFAAIEVAGVDKNGKSLGNHGIRPDASKSTGKVFRTLGGKTMVHSNECDDEFADIEGNVCKSGRIRSSDRSCRGSVLRRGR